MSDRNQIAEGLLYTHTRVNANTSKVLDAAATVEALVDVLAEKGILNGEFEAAVESARKALMDDFRDRGLGAVFQETEEDKYRFEQGEEIDCAERLHLCKASCCRLPFALSKQDLREGVVRWDLGQPYMIEQKDDGYCTHLDRDKGGCTIYEKRPVPCRGFDCREDERLWLDFENRIPNPRLSDPAWPRTIETADEARK